MDAFSCPSCAVRLMVPEDLAGAHVNCPECATRVPVPSPIAAADFVRHGGLPSADRSVPTPVGLHDFLPHDPTDNGRLQPWRVGRWIGTGGAIVFGGAALLLLCAVQGYKQIAAAANAAVKPPVAFPRPALVIPPPPVRARPVVLQRAAEGPAPPPEPAPAPIIIGAGGD
jgi:hypothetical protein